jgi:hypothetical protein
MQKRRQCTWSTATYRSVVFGNLYVLQYGRSMRCKPADSQSRATVRFRHAPERYCLCMHIMHICDTWRHVLSIDLCSSDLLQ